VLEGRMRFLMRLKPPQTAEAAAAGGSARKARP